ncbi:hypothetical protein [Acinetobacter bereziniae]|jgi:hypothetical protein|uniref:hypothetical protein n=1 Tax=Acinetobacter bereziniae TaxID=106648 RepID=UPI00125EE128|nr:hypothetical protein [Acinetobacter bereziniae]
MKDSSKIFTYIIAVGIGLLMTKTEKIMGAEVAKMLGIEYSLPFALIPVLIYLSIGYALTYAVETIFLAQERNQFKSKFHKFWFYFTVSVFTLLIVAVQAYIDIGVV